MSAREPHVDDGVPPEAEEAAREFHEALGGGQFPVFAVRVDRDDRIALDVETATWTDLDELRDVAEAAGWHVEDARDRNLLAYWNSDDAEGSGQ